MVDLIFYKRQHIRRNTATVILGSMVRLSVLILMFLCSRIARTVSKNSSVLKYGHGYEVDKEFEVYRIKHCLNVWLKCDLNLVLTDLQSVVL